MKTYEEMTSSVLKKIHEQDTRQKKRRTMILRTAVPVCGAFAVTGALVLTQLKQPALTGDSEYVAGGLGGEFGGDLGGSLPENTNSDAAIGIWESESSASSSYPGTPSSSRPVWESVNYNPAPENLNISPSRKLSDGYDFEKLSPEEAKIYYGINIFALEDAFPKCKSEYNELSIRKKDGKTVEDGNFVDFHFSDSSESVLALFRKETKWVPDKEYEKEYLADIEITFFKDDHEIKAIFEVNGTQITLLYNGTDMRKLFNVIKVFSASELRENSGDPIITGGFTDGTN